MLQVATAVSAADYPEPARTSSETHSPPPRPSVASEPNAQTETRYGEQPRFKVSALGLTVLLHALVIAMLFGLRHQAVLPSEERLVSVNLSSAPPPPPQPPAQSPETPELHQPSVTVPTPLLDVSPEELTAPVAVVPPPSLPEPATGPAAPAAPPASAPASLVQEGDLGNRMISGKPPRYPVESRRKKEQGTVVLSLILGFDGAVEQISVRTSSGYDRLDKAALHAVRKWRWEPIVRGGQPVKVKGIVEIPFILQS